MVTAENVSLRHSTQRRLPGLSGIAIAGVLLAMPALAQTGSEGVPLHGFADAGFALHSQAFTPGTPNKFEIAAPKGFNVGSFDLYLTPQFDNNVKALVELIFEITPDGGVATDLERVQMGYTFSDNATLWAGRFHTPYGFWNTAFHHGAQIQTSIFRPRFLDFEDKGGILPAHMVGLWSTGKARAGDGKFTYDIFAGNGPQISMGPEDPAAPGLQTYGTLNINVAGDDNHRAMVGLNVGYEPSGDFDGMRLAIHALRGEVADNSDSTLLPATVPARTSLNNTELNIIGGSFAYLENDWELLTELYSFNNKDKSGNTGIHKSSASYLQIGKTFTNLTAFIRKEMTSLSQLDNYFSMQENGQSYTRHALGFKYDLDQKASLKLELHYTEFAAEAGRTAYSYRSLYTQYAIRF